MQINFCLIKCTKRVIIIEKAKRKPCFIYKESLNVIGFVSFAFTCRSRNNKELHWSLRYKSNLFCYVTVDTKFD